MLNKRKYTLSLVLLGIRATIYDHDVSLYCIQYTAKLLFLSNLYNYPFKLKMCHLLSHKLIWREVWLLHHPQRLVLTFILFYLGHWDTSKNTSAISTLCNFRQTQNKFCCLWYFYFESTNVLCDICALKIELSVDMELFENSKLTAFR